MSSGEKQRLPTSRDDRAVARDERRNLLQVPPHGLGRADIIRSRSPSPSPANTGTFEFPPQQQQQPEEEQFDDAPASTSTENMATTLSVDDIVKIATASAKAAAQELATTMQNPAADADAAATATTSANNHVKKVELPTFDKANIHKWIRRVEAAFGRAGVTLAKDKFFFIEAKIDVNLNPKVNEFLCGDSTEAKWDEFLEYLQNEYGRSKEQQAALFLKGIPRDGLRPTQHLAKIRDLTKDIKLDDLIKEMVLRDLPTSVRQSLAERSELSPDDAAKAADNYFDKEGNPKHRSANSTVSSVNDVPDLVDTEDETDQVNAIGRGKFRGGFANRGKGRPFKPKNFTPAFSDGSQQSGGGNRGNPQNQKKPSTLQQICRYHRDFGEKAFNCEPGCQFKKQGQASSGNGPAGRRK